MSMLSERIRNLRKTNKLTQDELAKLLRDKFNLKTDRITVSRWETGYQIPETYSISCLAKIFKVSMDYLNGDENNSLYSYENIEPIPDMAKVPIIGQIACGEPLLAEENIETFVNMPKDVKGTFALRCKGNSMINARIFDGDIVFIRQQPDVENGEIAAVLIGDEATLKRVYKYENRIELRPENPTYPIQNYEGENLNNIRILGKAVGFLSTII